jgi:hypothetical protein
MALNAAVTWTKMLKYLRHVPFMVRIHVPVMVHVLFMVHVPFMVTSTSP